MASEAPPPYSAAPSKSTSFGSFLSSLLGRRVQNTTIDVAKRLRVHLVMSLDISGSMVNNTDALNPAGGPYVDRFKAASANMLRYMDQLRSVDRLVQCDVLLFGERLHEFRNVRDTDALKAILANVRQFERYTRTDLVLSRANEYFFDFQRRHADEAEADRPTFVHLILTDGSPNDPDMSLVDVQTRIANLLVEGTDGMRRDEDRATLFVQYGTKDYAPSSAVSQFLRFLDDELQEVAAEYFKGRYPEKYKTDDDCKDLYDACDVGKQGDTWAVKDPDAKMKGVDRNAPWDDDIDKMITIALAD